MISNAKYPTISAQLSHTCGRHVLIENDTATLVCVTATLVCVTAILVCVTATLVCVTATLVCVTATLVCVTAILVISYPLKLKFW